MRKQTWLTINDVEDHFTKLCGLPDVADPFDASERFIRTFDDGPGTENQLACFTYLSMMRHDMMIGGDDYAE